MCSNDDRDPVAPLLAGLRAIATTDMTELDDAFLRRQLLELLTASNRLEAEVVRRLDASDRRGLHEHDGCRTAKTWLQAFGRISSTVAHRLSKAARLLRHLPQFDSAFRDGVVTGEHLRQVSMLAEQVGVEHVAAVEATLAEAASALDVRRFEAVCARVRAHVDPDGPAPAPVFERRQLSIAASGGMLSLRGDLDPEGGAALSAALDSLSPPPTEGDERTAGMRRADALVELARRHLAAGDLPTVAGHRPQVGVMVFPQALSPETLARLATSQRPGLAASRLADFAADPAHSSELTDASSTGSLSGSVSAGQVDGGIATDTPWWKAPGWADPPWLLGIGAVPAAVAQRLACDADVFRIVMDPANGMPLDVGRSHRLVPSWLRRVLWARDRGCRFAGCTAKVEWTDAHHLTPWADGGSTSVDQCILLCRYHHGLVHEGGWSIDLHLETGQVRITRPDGTPYQLAKSLHGSFNGPTTLAA